MRYLALDSEYRRRWELFYLADGTVRDSRLLNWRQVEWDRVVKIEVYIRDQKHVVTCEDPRFLFFLNFRTKALLNIPQPGGSYKKEVHNTWVVGWTDGVTCYLKEIGFVLGNLVREYKYPLQSIPGHVHPRVQSLVPHITGMQRIEV